jgi:hypothetical protein
LNDVWSPSHLPFTIRTTGAPTLNRERRLLRRGMAKGKSALL